MRHVKYLIYPAARSKSHTFAELDVIHYLYRKFKFKIYKLSFCFPFVFSMKIVAILSSYNLWFLLIYKYLFGGLDQISQASHFCPQYKNRQRQIYIFFSLFCFILSTKMHFIVFSSVLIISKFDMHLTNECI